MSKIFKVNKNQKLVTKDDEPSFDQEDQFQMIPSTQFISRYRSLKKNIDLSENKQFPSIVQTKSKQLYVQDHQNQHLIKIGSESHNNRMPLNIKKYRTSEIQSEGTSPKKSIFKMKTLVQNQFKFDLNNKPLKSQKPESVTRLTKKQYPSSKSIQLKSKPQKQFLKYEGVFVGLQNNILDKLVYSDLSFLRKDLQVDMDAFADKIRKEEVFRKIKAVSEWSTFNNQYSNSK